MAQKTESKWNREEVLIQEGCTGSIRFECGAEHKLIFVVNQDGTRVMADLYDASGNLTHGNIDFGTTGDLKALGQYLLWAAGPQNKWAPPKSKPRGKSK